MTTAPPTPALTVRDLTKAYHSGDQTTLANDAVDLIVAPGALHAIVGENGAGKSTLAHVLAGLVRPDTGNVDVFGVPLPLGSTPASRKLGIGLVAQHFTLVDTLTVWENVILGQEPTRALGIDRESARARVADLTETLRLDVSPDAVIETLPLPTRQGIEIAKALLGNARILILDEPTSVLGPEESRRLFDRIDTLRDSGTTVLLVTHRMREVLDHATHCTVLRHGKSVAAFERNAFDGSRIIESILGQSPESVDRPSTRPSASGIALDLRGVSVKAESTAGLSNITLSVERGEIVGIAGVAGNGQGALADIIAGARRPETGVIRFGETDVTHASSGQRRASGLAYIPEDRRRSALVADFSVRDNLFLGGQQAFGRPWRWDREQADESARDLIRDFDVRTPSTRTRVGDLSGGNQQKVVLARELSRQPNIVLAVHPTQGLDLGAAGFVHQRLLEACASGCGIVLVSHDLDELRKLSDRICVIYRGQLVGECPTDDYDEARIGAWMTSGNA